METMIEIIRPDDEKRRREKLAAIAGRQVALDLELQSEVAAIVEDVRRRGDAALIDCTHRFDRVSLEQSTLRVDEGSLRETASLADPLVLDALREAIGNVRRFHEQEIQHSWQIETGPESWVGQRISAIEKVGLYIPGGTASYPSSVIMNVVPAQVAGVPRIVVVTPPRTLSANPATAAALLELGVREIYRVGGAQAIAALAFGTETIPCVDKITGPGNRYVAAAKRLVYGVVGIDSIAGPTEVVIIADDEANPAFIAADLLAQAEHDEDASAVLITNSETLGHEVGRELATQLPKLPRSTIIQNSLAKFGAIFVVRSVDEACELANDLAPEHLQIMTRDSVQVAARVHNAGAIFLGSYSPEAVGDYLAGPNHVLPTARAARFSSPLGVNDFIKRSSLIKYSEVDLRRTAPLIARLARAEGLEAHAQSTLIRTRD